MTETTSGARSRTPWLVILLIFMVVIVSLLIGYLSRQQNDVGPEITMTPESGGITLVADEDDESADSTNDEATTAEGDSSPGEGEDASTLGAGSKVVSAGIGRPLTSVYADADSQSLIMNVYNDGTAFTVVEPSGEFKAYPVIVDDMEWYRVRAEDGLVGWVLRENLMPQE